jgi:uncharacterized membrane protein
MFLLASEAQAAHAGFAHWMERVTQAFEVFGVGVFAVGFVVAFARYVMALGRGEAGEAYEDLRTGLGAAILLGLEILIVADIIETITVELTIESAAILGIIVLVRTFLSFSLEIELEGIVPWRRIHAKTRSTDER